MPCAQPLPPPRALRLQAKRVLWGGVEPACDGTVARMDYKQLRRFIKRCAACTLGGWEGLACGRSCSGRSLLRPPQTASSRPSNAEQLCCSCPLFCRSEMVHIGLQREPSEADFRYLASRAGFVVGGDAVKATSASLEELAQFKAWFAG